MIPQNKIQTSNSHAFLQLLRAAWTQYEEDYARYFAAAMVYYALVSLVPLLLLLIAALGLVLRWSDVARDVELQLLRTLELNFGDQLRISIQELLERLEQSSVTATLVSLVALVFTASVLFRHLRMTFRAIWNHAPLLVSSVRHAMRSSVLERLIAFSIVLGGGLLLVAGLIIIGTFHWVIAHLADVPLVGRPLTWSLSMLSPLLIAPITFGLLFLILPPLRLHLRHVWLAALLSGVAWIVGTEILALYVVYAGHKFGAYGAIGGVLMFMLWMHALSKVLFLGGELCKVIYSREGQYA
jgi:membrane protein